MLEQKIGNIWLLKKLLWFKFFKTVSQLNNN